MEDVDWGACCLHHFAVVFCTAEQFAQQTIYSCLLMASCRCYLLGVVFVELQGGVHLWGKVGMLYIMGLGWER